MLSTLPLNVWLVTGDQCRKWAPALTQCKHLDHSEWTQKTKFDITLRNIYILEVLKVIKIALKFVHLWRSTLLKTLEVGDKIRQFYVAEDSLIWRLEAGTSWSQWTYLILKLLRLKSPVIVSFWLFYKPYLFANL